MGEEEMTMAKNDAIATNQQPELARLKKDLAANGKLFTALLKATDQELARFMAEAFQAIQANPKLLACNRGSLMMAIGEAASMGLSINPNLGEAWIIPRSGKANFQIGYKGLLKLADRSNRIDWRSAEVVYRGEHYIRRGGTDPMIEHIPDDVDGLRTGRAEDIVAAYAVVMLKGSTRPLFRAVSAAELQRTARSSGDPRNDDPSDVWIKFPEAMARKTALIRIASMLPHDDKLRAIHVAAEREGMREAGKAPPPLPGLEQLQASADHSSDDLESMLADGDDRVDEESHVNGTDPNVHEETDHG